MTNLVYLETLMQNNDSSRVKKENGTTLVEKKMKFLQDVLQDLARECINIDKLLQNFCKRCVFFAKLLQELYSVWTNLFHNVFVIELKESDAYVSKIRVFLYTNVNGTLQSILNQAFRVDSEKVQ